MMLSKKNKVLISIVVISSILFVLWMFLGNDIQGRIKATKGIGSAVNYLKDIDQEELEDFEKSLTKVDDKVIYSFLRHNGTIGVYTSQDFSNVVALDFTNDSQGITLFDSIGGYCEVRDNKKPYKVDVVYAIKVSTNYSNIALAHEFGHYIDYVSGSIPHITYTEQKAISDSPEFQIIYEEEKDNSGLTTYFTDSSAEYFAESYKQMRLNPDTYYENCPRTCAYIDEVIKNL